MIRFLLAFAMVLAGVWRTEAAAQIPVRVGGYEFPPFVETDRDGPHGLTLRLIALLNGVQGHYRFEFVPVSARRRYGDLVEGRFDVMFFENPQWEWRDQGFPVDFTKVFLQGGEVYIALAQPGRGQDYFDDVAGKRLVGILGYHYGFAGYDADPERLARRFDLKLVSSHRSSIEMVLSGRRDMAVVTDAYLNAFLRASPQAGERLLISRRMDQVYEHRVLVRRDGPIDAAVMDRLMTELGQSGRLGDLWREEGIR